MRRVILAVFTFFATCVIASDGPIDPLEAYKFSAKVIDNKTIEAKWQIKNGYYLYRHKISFSAEPQSVKLGEPLIPSGKIKDDEFFGRVEIYHNDLIVQIPIQDAANVEQVTLKATSQGCWDGGVCYPPITQEVGIELNQTVDATDSGGITKLLRTASLYVALLTFFGFGLLLSFTPCVFPMIPILSGIIVQHGHAITHAKAFWLSLIYVLGMAATYAIIGVVAGLSGTLLSNAMQNVWVLSAFAMIFVALAFSMFGFYELRMPTAMQTWISGEVNKQGGSAVAIATMGALSALIVSPCVAAPLAGALIYIAQTKDAVYGGLALFAMALGMGAPLLVVGLFSRSALPKAGAWMKYVQRFFGMMMLAMAVWIVMPVLPLNKKPTEIKSTSDAVMFEPVFSLADLNEQVKQASLQGKPVMLDFYADWCVSCKELEGITFADPKVAAMMKNFVLLRADITANSATDKELLQKFNLFGPPAVLFFDKNGKLADDLNVVGYLPPEKFYPIIERASR